MGIAVVYLLVVAAGFTGALLTLVWLFGEAPDEGPRTGHVDVHQSQCTDRFGASGMPPTSVGPERPEDEAA